MLYLSLGSQPVVSSVLKDCNLNTNSTISIMSEIYHLKHYYCV